MSAFRQREEGELKEGKEGGREGEGK